MKEYIYISIPKTATNTIHNFLDKNNHKYNHLKPDMIKKQCSYYNRAFKFAFVRNPYDIILSWYRYHKYSHTQTKEVENFYPDDIKEWIFDMNFKTHWELKSHLKNNSRWDLSNPLYQHKWLYDNNDNIQVDFIGKIENFVSDFKYVCNILELGYKQPPILNSTTKENLVLDAECKDKIFTTFKKDFELLNYDK